MFTGIIEEVGQVVGSDLTPRGFQLQIQAPLVTSELHPGDSVAVDGVCLTVVAVQRPAFVVEVITTSLSRTTLGQVGAGRRLNLERALVVGARLGGHLVQGHVDGVGELVRIWRDGEYVLVDFTMPEAVAEATVLHGSIAVNGVSLTVNRLPARGVGQVALIPFTWEHTTFPYLAEGDRVNLEADLIGKYVVQHLRRTSSDENPAVTADEENG